MSSIPSSRTEIWKPITGFEGWYKVSNYGRLKRLPRMSRNSKNRETFKPYKERIRALPSHRNKAKYISSGLYRNGTTTSIQWHVMVLSAFEAKPFPEAVVNHKDGNKHNNQLSNLEWLTYSQNSRHAIENKLWVHPKGEATAVAQINDIIAKQILALRSLTNMTYQQIADQLGITRKIARDVGARRTWKHIDMPNQGDT